MGPVEAQLQRLAERYPGASWQDRGAHGLLVNVPGYALPHGWNKSSTHVKFLVPQGYPYSRPDSFWTDGDLRVSGQQQMPQNTQNNPAIPDANGLVWFSWHLQQWDPNRDDLLSWMGSISERLHRIV